MNEKIKKGGKLHYNDIFDATHWRPKAIEFPGPEPEVLDSSDDDIHLSDDDQDLTLRDQPKTLLALPEPVHNKPSVGPSLGMELMCTSI